MAHDNHDNSSNPDKHGKQGQSSYDPIPDSGKLYETRDVSLSAILKWIVFLFVFVGASAVVTLFIYKVFVPQGEESVTSSLPRTSKRQLPPGPRLQADPVQDIKEYREREQIALHAYGRDPRTGAIHVPIDRAIDLVLPDLPIRPGAAPSSIAQTTAPNTPPTLDGQAPIGTGSQNANGAGRPDDQPTNQPGSQSPGGINTPPADSSPESPPGGQAPANGGQIPAGGGQAPGNNSPPQNNRGQSGMGQ